MPKTVYIVNEVGFEYNDEIYRQPECNCLEPIKAYQSKEAATNEAMLLNIKELRSAEIETYGYELIDLFNNEHARDKAVELLGLIYEADLQDFSNALKKAPKETLIEVLKLMEIQFYTVTEVNIVD